jgi:hypothetical protein
MPESQIVGAVEFGVKYKCENQLSAFPFFVMFNPKKSASTGSA